MGQENRKKVMMLSVTKQTNNLKEIKDRLINLSLGFRIKISPVPIKAYDLEGMK